MKKLYTIILFSAFGFATVKSNATTHFVGVGVNLSGTAANVFTPSLVNAVVGDSVCWTMPLAGTTHTVTDNGVSPTVLPATAALFNSGNMTTVGQTFGYKIMVSGNYTYQCLMHSSMLGFINVATGINEAMPVEPTIAFPSPCSNKISFKYSGIDKIELFNLLGEQVKSSVLTANAEKVEMDVTDLTAGIYFYRTSREGIVIETKKIVKAK